MRSRLVKRRLKRGKNVSTQVEKHPRLVCIIFVCENAFVGIGLDNLADENDVVASFELTVKFAF